MEMNNTTFGITMLVCGMGGTVLTLWIMSLIMGVLRKVFPYKKEEVLRRFRPQNLVKNGFRDRELFYFVWTTIDPPPIACSTPLS